MSETASLSRGIAGRYATALFDLAKAAGALDAIQSDAAAITQALTESAELRDLIHNPIYSRSQQQAGITAVARAAGLNDLTGKTLGLMASKRRLFTLPHFAVALREMIAREKGEIAVSVTSAQPLTDAQVKALSKTLAAQVGRDVTLETTVDESLIGGLKVQVGSRMIDTSIKAKLAALQNTMKEAR